MNTVRLICIICEFALDIIVFYLLWGMMNRVSVLEKHATKLTEAVSEIVNHLEKRL